MEKTVCVIVLSDNSFTSDLPAHLRSQIGVCLLFASITCKSILGARTSWLIWMNINFSQIDNMHFEKGTVEKLSSLL